MKRIFSLIAILAAVSACSSKPNKDAQFPKTLEEAVANANYRTQDNMARDQYRHPLDTLKFFGVKPDMTVVEISPAKGWYTQILAPYLAEKGHYIAAAAPVDTKSEHMQGFNQALNAWFDAHPEVKAKSTITAFAAPTSLDIAPAGTADMVLTFRNVHNWAANGAEKAAFESFYKALKPGGVLGVVEHRANPKAKRDPKAKSGYVLEKDIIKVAQSVGFKLDTKSEVNANAKDTKNYPEGVWTLPPTLKLKDKDQAKYVAIGESDRMTLRFVKPDVKPTAKK